MAHVINVQQLLDDKVITQDQSDHIIEHARETMTTLAINTLLVAGILAATGGLIFYLASAFAVAVTGVFFLALGAAVLLKTQADLTLFGSSAVLIGAGLLIGGASIELLDKYEDIAPMAMTLGGAGLVLGMLAIHHRIKDYPFVTGAITIMALAMHLTGLAAFELSGLWMSAAFLYAAAAIFALGTYLDVRLVSALAIVPFAQMLDVSTFYWTGAYVFYSPYPTLSILQMTLLIGACLWMGARLHDRWSRHTGQVMIMGFIVFNLCFLVASLWGDMPGRWAWDLAWHADNDQATRSDYRAARRAWRNTAWEVSEHIYAILWAGLLVAIAAASAFANRRGLFNTAMTFAGIHAYTQAFESFGDEPLFYAIGGLAAIPLAWGLRRLNQHLVARA